MHHQNKDHITAKPIQFQQGLLPESLFEHFANQPWAMWLDSCNSTHVDSQYDILVWQPAKTLTTINDKTTILDCATKCSTIKKSDPLHLLQIEQKAFFKNKIIDESSLPFLGGAIGYFSYDLGRQFEKVPTNAIKDITIPDMAIGIYQHAIIYDNHKQQYSLICLNDEREQLEKSLFNLVKNQDKAINCTFKLHEHWRANMSKTQYQEKFEKIQAYLHSGDCYQINLTQRFSTTYQGDEFQAYKLLRAANQAPFSAFINLPNATILSISPERFLKLNETTVQSKPIKGTKPRSDATQIDKLNAASLANSEKDQAENLMIVDLLRNDISKVCIPGSVLVPKLFDIESFPAVHHLVSTVVGQIDEKYDATDLLRASFPGGSITGAPKIRAMEIIDELEPQRRSLYCGSIGYISACGNMDTSITIRTIVCETVNDKHNIHCWAGGGIVADSDVDAEYQESFDKVNKILPILANI